MPVMANKLPGDLVGVIGVPRAGMIVAAMLAEHLHVQLAEAGSFLDDGVWMEAGPRLNVAARYEGKVLLVDDSSRGGASIMPWAETLREKYAGTFEVLTAAMYVTPGAARRRSLDFWGRRVKTPRLFEWNWLHHRMLRSAALDLDGVLCCDPTTRETDDVKEWAGRFRAAQSRYLPRRRFRMIVTARLAKYRKVTQRWLRSHGIACKRLVMHPASDTRDRRNKRRWGSLGS